MEGRAGLVVLFCVFSVNLHDENTPFNSQLLNNDDGTTLRVFRDFCKIHWHLRRCDTDCDSVEHPAGNEHTPADSCNLNSSTHKPPYTGENEGIATAEFIRDWTSHDRTNY